MSESLTTKQEKVLRFIERYQMQHGGSPTLKEIRVHLGVSSDNSVLKHLDALQRKGVLKRDDTPRSIGLLQSVRDRLENPGIKLPMLGTVPAGNPVSIEENTEEWVSVAEHLVSKPTTSFLLKVRGDSMIDAGILDGDIVIVQSDRKVRHNDIVVALIDNENTVKRYIGNGASPYLKPENQQFSDIHPVNELLIQGVVTGLLRRY